MIGLFSLLISSKSDFSYSTGEHVTRVLISIFMDDKSTFEHLQDRTSRKNVGGGTMATAETAEEASAEVAVYCLICLTSIESSTSSSLSCNHCFHESCLQDLHEMMHGEANAASVAQSCPMCPPQLFRETSHLTEPASSVFEQAASRYDGIVLKLSDEVYTASPDASPSPDTPHIFNEAQVAEVNAIVRLLHRAATLGHVGAYFISGILYANRGVTQHPSIARRWSREPTVADAHAEAQFIIGRMQNVARRVRRQDIESFEFFVKAASQGNSSGEFDSFSFKKAS